MRFTSRVPGVACPFTCLLAGAIALVFLAGLSLRPVKAVPASTAGSIPLTIRRVSATLPAQSKAALFTGIPFPPATCRDPRQLELLDAAGDPAPCQVSVLSRYADGSVRVALLGCLVQSLPAGGVLNAQVRYGTGYGRELSAPLTYFRNPDYLALCPPRWYGESGVFNLPFLASADNQLFPAFESRMRERWTVTSDPPSLLDPDYRGYYDHLHALYATLLRDGGPASSVRRIADEVHTYRDLEILHTGPYRGQYHAGNRLSHSTTLLFDTIRRQYPLGLLEDYYLTGDPRSLEVALEIGETLVTDAYRDVDRFTAMERQPGFEIMGLCALYEHDPSQRRYLDAARYLAEVEMDHQDAMAKKYPNQGGIAGLTGGFIQDYNDRWYDSTESQAKAAGSPWMTGLLAEGLIHLYWITGDPRVKESLLRSCEWLATAGFVAKTDRRNNTGYDGFWYVATDPKNTTVYPALNPMCFQLLGFGYQATPDPVAAERYRSIGLKAVAANSWGRSLKEFNQAMHSAAQGLYLLQAGRSSIPLTLGESGLARDGVAPKAPCGIAAVPANGQVSLTWQPSDASRDPDVAGYLVYRGTAATGPYSLLTGAPVAGTRFTDSTLSKGATYWYRLTAVDYAGNVSAPTEPFCAKAESATGRVSGVVVAGGSGLSGVIVHVGGQSAVTDSLGAFTVTGIPAGAQPVAALKSGYTFAGPDTASAGATGIDFTATNAWIFRDAFSDGWAATTVRARFASKVEAPVAEEFHSVSATFTGANGYLQFSGPGIPLAGKRYVKLLVHGGTAGWQRLTVQGLVNGRALSGKPLLRNFTVTGTPGDPVANQWTEYCVPLEALGATEGTLTGLRVGVATKQKIVYLDAIRIE